MEFNSLFDMLKNSVKVYDKNFIYKYKSGEEYVGITYKDFYQKVLYLISGFKEIGIKKGDKLFIFSDNRIEWMIIDFALQGLGAVGIPRGTDTAPNEVDFILKHSEATRLIIENSKCEEKLANLNLNLQTISISNDAKNVKYNLDQLFKIGKNNYDKNKSSIEKEVSEIRKDDTVTIIYTSGTTGNPKGVMLTHRNFLHNAINTTERLLINNHDRFISMLPIWHVFQRTCEYITIYAGTEIYYSNLKNFTKDIKVVRPTMLAVVPRILESFYEKVQFNLERSSAFKKILFNFFYAASSAYFDCKSYVLKREPLYKSRNPFIIIFYSIAMAFLFPSNALAKLIFKFLKDILGGKNRILVSGGGALPRHIDKFFNVIGFNMLDGYGLTESSPIIAVRDPIKPVLSTIGKPLKGVEAKIISIENKSDLPFGEKGELVVKGELVMKGYYRNEELTNKTIENGFLHTGDLAVMTKSGEISILGRIKDTIVLSGGENVEPEHLEAYLNKSEFISNSIIVGHNQKKIGALITLNKENLLEYCKQNSISYESFEELTRKEFVT
ncbi:MAG TPA: AMP-binding protein, partial [Spirochaetota bacterium]|nr:AMP-binding protein [Spirochaetota bacterium]